MLKKTLKGWVSKDWQMYYDSTGVVWHNKIIRKKDVKSFFNMKEVTITITEE